MSNPDGAWIFLSHSTKDWDEVRWVRNLLEEKGHRPLVFFLKCLTAHSELDELIRREIEARTWFLLCDSHNARESSWVQAEVACIKRLKGKHHEEIDLNGAIETQIARIDRLCKRVTVFLSHGRDDLPYARRIKQALVAHDYSVWLDVEDIGPGTDWRQEITGALDAAVERGFVLLLLSRSSMKSMAREIDDAFDKASRAAHAANIVPIMIEDLEVIRGAMPSAVRSLLGGIQWFDFSHGDFDTNMAALIADMKARVMD